MQISENCGAAREFPVLLTIKLINLEFFGLCVTWIAFLKWLSLQPLYALITVLFKYNSCHLERAMGWKIVWVIQFRKGPIEKGPRQVKLMYFYLVSNLL